MSNRHSNGNLRKLKEVNGGEAREEKLWQNNFGDGVILDLDGGATSTVCVPFFAFGDRFPEPLPILWRAIAGCPKPLPSSNDVDGGFQGRKRAILRLSRRLNTGAKIPLVGLVTWQAAPSVVGEAVAAAVKAMAQVGGIVMLQPEVGGSKSNFFFVGIDKVRFIKPVIAGDTLVMRMTLVKLQKRFGITKMEGKAYVGNFVVCEGDFLMAMGKEELLDY